ncbi:MAG: HlyD family secretion protein [Terrimicrobiaceae bacterium]|nr:HlyD family secretion protein [Terrimicrobiaceae bacterium]
MKSGYKYAITLSVVLLALVGAFLLYERYSLHPWTRDGQVRANIVGIAPRIAGPIIEIPIKDNQPVKKGDLLFAIDPATFQAAADVAAAKLQQAQANALQAQQSLDRQSELYKTNVVGQQEYQNAQDQFYSANANVAAAKAQLANAQLNLNYTRVYAPVDGYLTNVNTSPGTYVNAGEQLLALVDASSFWIAAYFKETQISQIQPGAKARITLMGHAGRSFQGIVESTGWAIFLQDGASVELIPQVAQTIDWVRLPQRFPVRIQVTGKPPVPLRIGQTVSVSIEGR